MVVQTLHDFGVLNLSVADMMLAGPYELALILDFDELVGLCMALGALCGRVLTLIYITAYKASEFLFHVLIN